MNKIKKVAIVQSSYIPWIGFFDLINYVDEFILFDEVQYTKRDWRNRNSIKGPNGKLLLTIPVSVKGNFNQKISETLIADDSWKRKHLKSIELNYSKAAYFEENIGWIRKLYLGKYTTISEVNGSFIRMICDYLGINTTITDSSDYSCVSGKNERLIELVRQSKGTHYISGPAAKSYLDEALFRENGLKVAWFEYNKYNTRQLWGENIEKLSIIDGLLNIGRQLNLQFTENKKSD